MQTYLEFSNYGDTHFGIRLMQAETMPDGADNRVFMPLGGRLADQIRDLFTAFETARVPYETAALELAGAFHIIRDSRNELRQEEEQTEQTADNIDNVRESANY